MRNEKMSERSWLSLIREAEPVEREALFALCGERFGLSQRGVEKNITQAVAGGLVTAIPHLKNGRKRLYVLTEAGDALLATGLDDSGWGFRQRHGRRHAVVHDEASAVPIRAGGEQHRGFNERGASVAAITDDDTSNGLREQDQKRRNEPNEPRPHRESEREAQNAKSLTENASATYAERRRKQDEMMRELLTDYEQSQQQAHDARIAARKAEQEKIVAFERRIEAHTRAMLAEGRVLCGNHWLTPEQAYSEEWGYRPFFGGGHRWVKLSTTPPASELGAPCH
jgi:DNA-binding MarR family transcriptional regulator